VATQISGNGRRPVYDILVGASIIVTAAAIIWGVSTMNRLVTQMELANNNYKHTIREHERYERTHERLDREHTEFDRRLTDLERERPSTDRLDR
jgi:hypothetical protein